MSFRSAIHHCPPPTAVVNGVIKAPKRRTPRRWKRQIIRDRWRGEDRKPRGRPREVRDSQEIETERLITADKRTHVETGMEAQRRLMESRRQQDGRPGTEDNRA